MEKNINKFSNKKINIFGEIMNDGRGDYEWIATIIDLLKSYGVEESNIRVVYMNVYDFDKSLNMYNEIFKNISNKFLENDICQIITNENQNLLNNENDKFVIYNFGEIDKKYIEDNLKKIEDFDEKLYNYNLENDKILKYDNFDNVKKFVNKLLEGNINNDVNNNNVGKYVCKIEKIQYDIIKKNTKNQQFEFNNKTGKVGDGYYPVNVLSEYTKRFKNINIYYIGLSSLYSDEISFNTYAQDINIHFSTQSEIFDNIPNPILMAEGGQNHGFSCNSSYGYIKANPIGDENKLNVFLEKNELKKEKTCIAYISLGSNLDVPIKMSKFVKIICYSKNYIYDKNNIYTIYLVSNYQFLFNVEIFESSRQIIIFCFS